MEQSDPCVCSLAGNMGAGWAQPVTLATSPTAQILPIAELPQTPGNTQPLSRDDGSTMEEPPNSRREEGVGSPAACVPFTGIRLGANSSAFVKC